MTDHSIPVNFRQGTGLSKVLSLPADLVSSGKVGWKNLHVEYHRHPAHETPKHHPTEHVIAIETFGQLEAERQLGGQIKTEHIRPGDICVVPENTPHQIRSFGEQGLIFLTLDPSFLAQVSRSATGSDSAKLLPHFATADPLVTQLGLTVKKLLEGDAFDSHFYVESLSVTLAAHLIRYYSDSPLERARATIQPGYTPLPNKKIELAVGYIHAHLTEDLSLGAIAQSADMSQYHFCRAFKQVMRCSPWQYVIQQRVERAKQLLTKPKTSIAQISATLGFADQGQFSNFFRKHVGVSPSAYRKHL